MPRAVSVARMVGNRTRHFSAPNARASSHMQGEPVSSMRRRMALATTSRGARSAIGCTPCMKRTPSASTRNAPFAAHGLADQRLLPAGAFTEVGDSRMELDELEIAQHGAGPERGRDPVPRSTRSDSWSTHRPGRCRPWPSRPPARAPRRHHRCEPSPMTCRVTPTTEPSSSSNRSSTSACSTISMPAASSTRASNARSISAPVASPPAWAMRSRWWPPSRVSDNSPSRERSKRGTDLGQVAHRCWAFAHEQANGVLIAKTDPSHDGVLKMIFRRVARAEGRGNAALRPPGRAGGHHVLGHDHHPQGRPARNLESGRQPGHTGTDHDDVDLGRPARIGRGQLRRQDRHRVTSRLSIRRVLPMWAATRSRAEPAPGGWPRSLPRSSR